MKSPEVRQLLDEAKYILAHIGIPLHDLTARKSDKMAMVMLAVAGVSRHWKEASSLKDGRKLTTRKIIEYLNEHFEETISSGSYDDIRRKDLKPLVLADLIINSGDNVNAAPNDPTRGYSLDHEFKELLITFGTKAWEGRLSKFIKLNGTLSEKLNRPRHKEKVLVRLGENVKLEFGKNFHNILQKAIIEDFLPIYGFGADILYVGDTSLRSIIYNQKKLKEIGFQFDIKTELPDIIALSESKNWLYFIEAVTSSGPMTPERVYEIRKAATNCTCELIFVTAFLNKDDFRKWVTNIAWETEVWIADNPEHMIHFNGDKFLGPYSEK